MKDYQRFGTAHIIDQSLEMAASEILYQYLFRGLSVKIIEEKLFGSQEQHGYFAKTVLNYYGISTEINCGNRGLYKHHSLKEVIEALLANPDPSRQLVGEALKRKLAGPNQN